VQKKRFWDFVLKNLNVQKLFSSSLICIRVDAQDFEMKLRFYSNILLELLNEFLSHFYSVFEFESQSNSVWLNFTTDASVESRLELKFFKRKFWQVVILNSKSVNHFKVISSLKSFLFMNFWTFFSRGFHATWDTLTFLSCSNRYIF